MPYPSTLYVTVDGVKMENKWEIIIRRSMLSDPTISQETVQVPNSRIFPALLYPKVKARKISAKFADPDVYF